MQEKFLPRRGWGPRRCRAALAITFDNLGEAADIEMGVWGDRKVGEHFTAGFVTTLIDLLGEIRATYFVEGSNADIYPGALRRWQDAGHEVGLHAWRHEVWEKCPPKRRRELLAKSLAAMRAIGIKPSGFRPPGGALPAEARAELAEAGVMYCSDLGPPGVWKIDGMISLPFEWTAVDAYMLEDVLGVLRVRFGHPEQPFELAAWRSTLATILNDALAEGGQRTIIFHPQFLAQSEEKLAALQYLIRTASSADVWITSAGEIARFAAEDRGLLAASA